MGAGSTLPTSPTLVGSKAAANQVQAADVLMGSPGAESEGCGWKLGYG